MNGYEDFIVDTDFRQISPRCGGRREAFEELCCQLARRTVPVEGPFTRLRGAGGDGGIECFADLPDGNRIGWQAKYVFDVESLMRQAEESLTTALNVHPTLTKYILCFPFDLTGPTKRRGLSGTEKFDAWREKQLAEAKDRDLTIEAWPASKLLELLLQYDASGGIREFFFNQKILTSEWFSEHLESAKATAGPRYTPELNVKTDLWKWFAAFGRAPAWLDEYKKKMRVYQKAHERFVSVLHKSNSDSLSPTWPEELRADSQTLADDIGTLYGECDRLATIDDPESYKLCFDKLNDILHRLSSLESKLANDLRVQHGQGADSPGFRQFSAEYMVSFPAANLDTIREVIGTLRDLHGWLGSPSCSLAYERIFLLSGGAGSGKTHGVCDTADFRLSENHPTCLAFGHQFGGEPEPWTRLLETLGLPITLGRDGLLDALNAAGEASGSPFLLCIDAINETRPLRYWRGRLSALIQSVRQRSHLRLCITCRTSFMPFCLPEGHDLPIAEHAGFAGMEHLACRMFFEYYELSPPVAPILQPELSNPLYLRLLCETLRSRGLRRLPLGWQSLAPTIQAFLEEKERQFASEHETHIGSKIVAGCLMAISRAIADSGGSSLSFSQAEEVMLAARPQARNLPVLEWLIRNDLLIEDVPAGSGSFDAESVVRPAFERLGDFLVAKELLERCETTSLEVASKEGGALHALLRDCEAVERNGAVLIALSILIPEQHPGLELPNMVDDESLRKSLMEITIRAFSSRNPETFTNASEELIREALGWEALSFDAMDAVLSSSWQPSALDGIWLDELLKQKSLAVRDAYWCGYLHDRFECSGTVRRFIEAAFELPLDQLEPSVAERWVTVLLWFTAAADRRVKDEATRAATAILTAQPQITHSVSARLLESDDDEVRERVLLSCYGALIVSRDSEQCKQLAIALQIAFRRNPEHFDNALIRDHIRCISELAEKISPLSDGIDSELTMGHVGSSWPLDMPSDEKIETWGELLRFEPNEFMSDFFKYAMNCLRPWEDTISRVDMAKWMLGRIATVLGYENSGCENYDAYIISKYGGGRAKPTWTDRIGKKYQWIAMFQLASRLQDHVERKRDNWQPRPLRTPLILLEERKLDPTLPYETVGRERYSSADSWWIKSAAYLDSNSILSHEEWVASQDGVPTLEDLLSVSHRDEQRWRILVSSPSWGRRDEEADWGTPYRHVRTHVQSYLVKQQEFAIAHECLRKRNFFGGWMPEGASWLYGFAGEYPWATPFNTEPDEWFSTGGGKYSLPASFLPCWNELVVEWEYDPTIPQNFNMTIPARIFFSLGDLWWDGRDGYRLVGGKTIFRDPSVTESGPSSLLADMNELQERLDKLGFRLIWTLLGEKLIPGDRRSRVDNPAL